MLQTAAPALAACCCYYPHWSLLLSETCTAPGKLTQAERSGRRCRDSGMRRQSIGVCRMQLAAHGEQRSAPRTSLTSARAAPPSALLQPLCVLLAPVPFFQAACEFDSHSLLDIPCRQARPRGTTDFLVLRFRLGSQYSPELVTAGAAPAASCKEVAGSPAWVNMYAAGAPLVLATSLDLAYGLGAMGSASSCICCGL